MLWGYGHNRYFNSFSAEDRLYTSESDVYRRQILTYKDGPRNERVKPISKTVAIIVTVIGNEKSV